MKKIHLLLAGLSAMLFATCIREIDLFTDEGDLSTVVVDGDFTDSPGPHQVRLTRPNKFAFSKFEFIRDAAVYILDDVGNKAQYHLQFLPGDTFYELPPGAMPAVPGRLYHLEIVMPNGRTYRSHPQSLPQKVESDSLIVEGRIVPRVSGTDLVVEDERAYLTVRTTVPAGANDVYLRWDAHCVYYFPELVQSGPLPPPTKQCYVSDYFNLQNIPLLRLQNQVGKTVDFEIGSKLVDQAFGNSLYFNVVQRSISAEAFKFWEGFAKVANPQGTVFDPPPGEVRGNIFNPNDPAEVPLGYFEVASVDTLRRKIFNGDLGQTYYVLPPCDPNQYESYSKSECFDCLILKNSTTAKPTWWK